MGLDYFLLPHFLEGLLQPGGTDLAVVERDAWFRSAMCFVRDGPTCLANMIQQQKLGLDMLRGLKSEGGSDIRHKYEDHLPSQPHIDVKPRVLGSTRRHITNDQALRAASMLLPAQDVVSSHPQAVKPDKADTTETPTTSTPPTHDPEPELSDTDNEDQSDCRRRSARSLGKRKHLVSPSVARVRVLSLSRPSSTSKRIKKEPNNTSDKLSIVAVSDSDRSPRPHVPELDTLRFTLCAENPARSVSGTIVNRIRPSRYLVDGGHLAALMAVGDLPASPS